MNTTEPHLRVVLYARVSGEEQKHGHNIDSQIEELKQFAEQRGWSLVDQYRDEAWSGALLARPGLDRLRDDAGKKLFDAVLINDVDRLARDVTHLGVIKRDLERSGVRVIFRKIPSENSPTHNLLVNILGSFAEFERELIMDRTRRGRRHKVEARQEFIGCIPPYGYRYAPGDKMKGAGQLTIHAEEAAVVREMYKWVDVDGLSVRQVALRLERERIRPRKGATNWQGSSVRRILRASVYTGTWYYNKLQGCYPRSTTFEAEARSRKTSTRLRTKDEWIPVTLTDTLRIIPTDQWNRVQQQIDRNRSFSPRNSKHAYLLSGLVTCGGCGSRYVGNPSHGRFQYRCLKRCKRNPLIHERFLDESVWDAVEKALNNPSILMEAVTEVKNPTADTSNAGGQLELAISNLRGEEARVLEAYRLSVLTPDQVASELQLISDRRQLLDKQRREMLQQSQPASSLRASVEDTCRQYRERLRHLTFDTKRAILRLVVRRIVFEGDRVRISGVLPLVDEDRSADSEAHRRSVNQTAGVIAGTETDSRAHNPSVIASMEARSRARNPAAAAEFTLLGGIIKSREVAIAASRANLVKANAALGRS
ncbi:MAG: recombinase family protein [Acidobacteriota bacterium]|nr:recombinase family protein [Acidobacteriota bacterium]